jgi:hypothetical protein
MCCIRLQGELLRCGLFEHAGIDDHAGLGLDLASPEFPLQQQSTVLILAALMMLEGVMHRLKPLSKDQMLVLHVCGVSVRPPCMISEAGRSRH